MVFGHTLAGTYQFSRQVAESTEIVLLVLNIENDVGLIEAGWLQMIYIGNLERVAWGF